MKLISLLSGGIDSPVASYEMMKKGHQVILVHFYNYTQERDDVKKKIKDLAQALSKHQAITKLYMIPFSEIQKEIIKVVPSKFRMIVYRREMFRIAEKIMKKEKADAFLTGDNLGQVASQTLDNMSVIFKATKKVIATPLIGEDKVDTVRKAREIGTYEISIRPYSDCCTFLNAKHPETKAKLKIIEDIEKNMKLEKAVSKALEEPEILQIINKDSKKI
jgi:thiamine biosynthesis protein ThiI